MGEPESCFPALTGHNPTFPYEDTLYEPIITPPPLNGGGSEVDGIDNARIDIGDLVILDDTNFRNPDGENGAIAGLVCRTVRISGVLNGTIVSIEHKNTFIDTR